MLILAVLASFSASALAQVPGDAPFGWAVCTSLDSGDDYALTGGGEGRTIILQSDGRDMRPDVIKAIKDYDVIVFDGSRGDFTISTQIVLNGVRDRTLLGINGARIRTSFVVDDGLRDLLDRAGVKQMSTQGGGGNLSNGSFVYEECEQHTRQAIIDYTGDSAERYRASGLFAMNGCENIIIRNLDLVGPGPIDVGGADLLTLSDGSNHIWVDHCSFTDGMDGNFDINSRSDFITVSWCSFQYTENAYAHRVSCLVGSNESPSQGEDNLNVTYAFCLWGKDCQGRMPLVRWGRVHVLDCWYDCPQLKPLAINGRKGSETLVEACFFENGVKPFGPADDAIAWQLKDNIYKGKFTMADKGTITLPYSYTAVPAAQVPALVGAGAGATLDLEAPASTVDFTIHLMGDSTMADKDISKGNPERGWGMVFENFFDPRVRVVNYAKNGRSTKSVQDEGIWDDVVDNMREGDWLFVEFGHNDEKVDKENVGAPAWGAFQDNLRLFARTARSKGVTPVFLTPVARRAYDGQGILDETTHGDWPAAMKAVAAEMGVTLIDMEAATLDWIRAAGDEASRPYFMWIEPGTCEACPEGKKDNTHSTPLGARRNCEIVCDSIRSKIPSLAKYLQYYDIVVDADGRGDFLTLEEAAKSLEGSLAKPKTILVKPGVTK